MPQSLLHAEQTGAVTIWHERFAPVVQDLQNLFGGVVLPLDPRHIIPTSSALLNEGRIEVTHRKPSKETTVVIGKLGLHPDLIASLAAVDMYAQKKLPRYETHNVASLTLGPYATDTSALKDGECLNVHHIRALTGAVHAYYEPGANEAEALLRIKHSSIQEVLRTIATDYHTFFPHSRYQGSEVAAAILGVSSFTDADEVFADAEARSSPFDAASTLLSGLRILQGQHVNVSG
ncbi:MAG TPA: hypothetical protein VLF43_04240 [Candidatus Saccharimonadales bacterium]|nr:hypothetical protein [Candidatus Saccharimonadales bacterium]